MCIEAKQVEFRATVHKLTGELVARMLRLERRQESFEAAIDARFRQIEQTMATNVQVLLAAIQGRNPSD